MQGQPLVSRGMPSRNDYPSTRAGSVIAGKMERLRNVRQRSRPQLAAAWAIGRRRARRRTLQLLAYEGGLRYEDAVRSVIRAIELRGSSTPTKDEERVM